MKIIVLLFLNVILSISLVSDNCEEIFKKENLDPTIHSPNGWRREFKRHIYNKTTKKCLIKNAFDINTYTRSIGGTL